MCRGKKVGAMDLPPMNTVNWGAVAAAVGGSVGSDFIVNPIINTVFSKSSHDERVDYAAYVKIVLGGAAVLYGPNVYITSAGLGMLGNGAEAIIRTKFPDIEKLAKPIAGYGIGEVIDLSREDWAMNGVESDYSVGYAQEYAVSGGVN